MIKLREHIQIQNDELSKLIVKKIGDGKKDAFIEIDNELDEIINADLLDLSKLELGEFEIDDIKAIKKLGAVYLSDKSLNFTDKCTRIFLVAPNLNYKSVETSRHILIHNEYELILDDEKGNEYKLILISYAEIL